MAALTVLTSNCGWWSRSVALLRGGRSIAAGRLELLDLHEQACQRVFLK